MFKKVFFFIFVFYMSFLAFWTQATMAVQNIQDNYQLVYSILDVSGNPVTGETVTLKIKRVSDGYYLDFNDSTFKNTGWTSVSANLSEDSQGEFYFYTFNPPASETGAEQYVLCLDNASATYGDHQCLSVEYRDLGNSDFDYSSNQVTVATNNDKSGYSISGTKTTLDALNDITAASVWAVSTRELTGLDEDNTTIDLDASVIGDVNSAVTVDTLQASALADLFNTDSGTVYGSAVSGSVVKEIADNAGGSPPSAAAIADAVWDEAIAGHLTSGSTGESLNAAGGAGDPWVTTLGSYTGSQAGKLLSDIYDATDGDKESGVYTGIENTIRRNR